jgi:hypothetical protein
MLALFVLPDWSTGADDQLVAELIVEHLLAARG